MPDIEYSTRHAPTLAEFHADNSFVRGIRGPIGSGKSTACAMELVSRALRQEPGPDGIRRTAWAVIRNTYPELISTTMRTWSDWLKPEVFGRPRISAPITHRLRLNRETEMEVFFLAIDRPEDTNKLLSLEITGAWLNEARELPKAVLDMAGGRCGRFPPPREVQATWSGVIMDTNPPDDDHWWYRLAEEEQPEGYRFFNQPSGLSPVAENIPYLPGGREYYLRQIPGKTDEWVKVYIHGEYGNALETKPIYPEFVYSAHVSSERLVPYRGLPLIVGLDFGLTPAAAICQYSLKGQFRVLAEVVSENTGIKRFLSDMLKPVLATEFPNFEVVMYGDPAGSQRAQTDERTCFDEVVAAGFRIFPAETNVFTARREAVAEMLTRMVDGEPGIIFDPRCRTLIKGHGGRYCYRRMRLAGEDRYADVPDKTFHSHVCEALQYASLGTRMAGTGSSLVGDVGNRLL